MITLSVVPSDPALVELISALNAIGSGMGFRRTERTLSTLTGAIAKAWQSQVGSDHRIERKKITPFTHSIYSRDKVVKWLEYGLKPFDMKMTHPFGRKSRIVRPKMIKGKMRFSWTQKRKDGSTYTVHAGDSYLIVPFRHFTKEKGKKGQEGFESVYKNIQAQMGQEGFKRSRVTKSAVKGVETPNYNWQEMIGRAEYSWGTKLEIPEGDEFKNLQGMVAMGPAKHSKFMSFRVVSVNSPAGSWLHPGIKARHYLQQIIERGQDTIRTSIEEALKKDLGG